MRRWTFAGPDRQNPPATRTPRVTDRKPRWLAGALLTSGSDVWTVARLRDVPVVAHVDPTDGGRLVSVRVGGLVWWSPVLPREQVEKIAAGLLGTVEEVEEVLS